VARRTERRDAGAGESQRGAPQVRVEAQGRAEAQPEPAQPDERGEAHDDHARGRAPGEDGDDGPGHGGRVVDLRAGEHPRREVRADDDERGEQGRERGPREPVMGLADAREDGADPVERDLHREHAQERLGEVEARLRGAAAQEQTGERPGEHGDQDADGREDRDGPAQQGGRPAGDLGTQSARERRGEQRDDEPDERSPRRDLVQDVRDRVGLGVGVGGRRAAEDP
jgi:hypothetical protein